MSYVVSLVSSIVHVHVVPYVVAVRRTLYDSYDVCRISYVVHRMAQVVYLLSYVMRTMSSVVRRRSYRYIVLRKSYIYRMSYVVHSWLEL